MGEKNSLKLNIKEKNKKPKTKIMAFGPITSWLIEGENVEVVTYFLFLGSKIIEDGDCSQEIKTLVPCNKNYDKCRRYIKRQKHHFADKGL